MKLDYSLAIPPREFYSYVQRETDFNFPSTKYRVHKEISSICKRQMSRGKCNRVD